MGGGRRKYTWEGSTFRDNFPRPIKSASPLLAVTLAPSKSNGIRCGPGKPGPDRPFPTEHLLVVSMACIELPWHLLFLIDSVYKKPYPSESHTEGKTNGANQYYALEVMELWTIRAISQDNCDWFLFLYLTSIPTYGDAAGIFCGWTYFSFFQELHAI